MKRLCISIIAALVISSAAAVPLRAEQNKVLVFDFENNGDVSSSWIGPCMSNFAIESVRSAPGMKALSRNELKRHLAMIGINGPSRVPFELKATTLTNAAGDTLIEGSFTLTNGIFNFKGSVVKPDSDFARDISFKIDNFTIEKAEAELIRKINSVLKKRFRSDSAFLWGTISKPAYTAYWQAVWLYDSSNPDGAQGYLANSMKADLKFVPPRLLSATINIEKTRYSDAIDQLEKCLKMSPGNAEAGYLLGLTYLNLQRNSEAKTYLKSAVSRDPSNPEYHWQLGVVYRKTFQPDKALEELNTAVNLSPAMAVAWYELASIYALAGKKDKAMDCLEKVLRYARKAYFNKVINDADFNSLRNEKRYKEIIRNAQ